MPDIALVFNKLTHTLAALGWVYATTNRLYTITHLYSYVALGGVSICDCRIK